MVTMVGSAYQSNHSPLPSSLEKTIHSRKGQIKERTKESGYQEQEGLQPDVERQAVTSEFGKEDRPSRQAIFTHVLWFSSAKG